MSQLELHGRPWVVFDPANKAHRSWYAEFVQNNTWGRVPCRFIVTDDHGNLISMIEKKLVAYYTKKEFGFKN